MAHKLNEAAGFLDENKASFREYIERVRPQYIFYKHCEEMIDALQAVADGELDRLMFFMPPRSGKSELVSRLFPGYFLYKHPEEFVGLASYGADLAYSLSRNARDNFTRWGGKLSGNAAAVHRLIRWSDKYVKAICIVQASDHFYVQCITQLLILIFRNIQDHRPIASYAKLTK